MENNINNNYENTTNNKKKVFLIVSIGAILLLGIVGVTFAYFNFNQTSSNQQLLAGEMYIRFNEGNSIRIEDMTPSENVPDPSKYFQFTVTGKNTSSTQIVYDVSVLRGDLLENKTENLRIADRFIKFSLQMSRDGINFEPVVTGQSYADLLNGVRLYVGEVGTTSSVVTYTFRLFAWISDEVVITGGDATGGDYEDTVWGNMFATIKVRVTGDFASKLPDSNFYALMSDMAADEDINYVTTYSGTSNDTYNSRGTKPIYYFTGANAKENSNVLFAGYCWQIVRTTDTGGVKLLYNGVAENNQCLTTRTAKIGIKGNNGQAEITGLDETSVYGSGFTYTSEGFSLTGVVTGKNWERDHDELIGMYTCNGTSRTCGTISYIGRYENETKAIGATYIIGRVTDKYSIGASAFNGYYDAAAGVGYMYNKVYPRLLGVKGVKTYYAYNVTWNGTNYTLDGLTSETQDNPDTTHHYTCAYTPDSNAETPTEITDTTCEKVWYYIGFYDNSYRYIVLENGETVEDALYNQLNYKDGQTVDANLNVYNSAMKAYLDSWYAVNLENYSSTIDPSTTYCNDRVVTGKGGWAKNGGLTSSLTFTNYTAGRTDLSCENVMDRFSTENSKARLTYPIGLLTEPERTLMTSDYAGDGAIYWGLSPYGVYYVGATYVRNVTAAGDTDGYTSVFAVGARPSVSLRPGASFSEGDGSYASPYVVGEKVTRTIS